jgi:hypothetical protein
MGGVRNMGRKGTIADMRTLPHVKGIVAKFLNG